ncbi:hypothetical protein [Plantactinospora sp. B24E8]|uniref:hypothetical protein n=1 Tax=Plantactinospora sp. B24E8 TaxID=3153567 RepID=UPI00325F7940
MTSPRRMTRLRRRVAGHLVALSTLVLFGAGCGVIDTVQNVVDTANALSSFADRLGRAAELTYTAEYRATDRETGRTEKVTYAQQPPNSATRNGDSWLIHTPEHVTVCAADECQRLANQGGGTTGPDAELVATVGGPGYLTPELALALVAAAAIVPGTDVDTGEKTIAGQPSLCATVTGISEAEGDQVGSLRDFSVCVTESGVLASFRGTANTGEEVSLELVRYSDKVDGKAFAPPTGANLRDVTELSQS